MPQETQEQEKEARERTRVVSPFFLLIVFLIVLVAVAAACAYYWWQQLLPEHLLT